MARTTRRIDSTPAAERIELNLRVIPRARKTEIAGMREGVLVVRVAAPPVEGAANEALVDFLSALFHIPRRSVEILSGEHGRQKRVALIGVAQDDFQELLRS
jgi:uncharacterized protein (TIGR00251 family)